MTREQLIQRWEDILPAVFRAEDLLRTKLQAVLLQHKDDPATGAKEYVRMVATEIVSRMSDDDIAKLDLNE